MKRFTEGGGAHVQIVRSPDDLDGDVLSRLVIQRSDHLPEASFPDHLQYLVSKQRIVDHLLSSVANLFFWIFKNVTTFCYQVQNFANDFYSQKLFNDRQLNLPKLSLEKKKKKKEGKL